MAPARGSGQLDEISQAIGGLQASFESVERYIHDRRHDDKNVSQKIDGLSTQITREVTRMKAEIQVQLDAIDRRVAVLEGAKQREDGAKGVAIWFLQSPLVGWIAAALIAFVTWWKGGIR